jgi:cysteine desulfurase/selenocysteine lyase
VTGSSLYLDNAATSFPKPNAVYDAVDSYQRHTGAAFGRGTHGSDHADSLAERCRHQLAQLIGSSNPRSVAFTFNGTDGLNLLLRGVLRSGHHLVTTTLEHNSVLRPLHQLQSQLPITVDHVAFDPSAGIVDADAFRVACASRPPQMVVLNMASNVTGVPQPLADLIPIAKAAGAAVLIDAAQAVGHLPINVETLDVDLLAAPGHKGLCGPLGTGFVYVAPSIQDSVISFRSGGTGTESESLQQPTHMPQLLESGNLNMPGIAGLNAALTWRNSDDFKELSLRHDQMIPRFIGRLNKIPQVTVYCEASAADNIGVISLNIAGAEPHEVAMILSQSFEIQCRAGLHCAPLAHRTLGTESMGGTVRLSPGLFTTDKEIDRAVEAIEMIAANS